MIRNFTCSLSLAILAYSGATVTAQDIHNIQFNATPLNVNPAFTGMFNGSVRVSALYQNQWRSVTTPFTSAGISADVRAISFKNKSYLGLGLQVIQDKAGDDGLINFSGELSAAFHKVFNSGNSGHESDLAIGVQGGYAQRAVDLPALYFNGSLPVYTVPYSLGIGNVVNSYVINTGISFSQALGNRFNYTAGISGNNLNQPNDELLQKQNRSTGMDKAYTADLGANWRATNRLTIKPAIIYINHAQFSRYLAGAEFNYGIARHKNIARSIPSVFAGGWYRTGGIVNVNTGAEYRGLRIGVAYECGTISGGTARNGTGGFEIMARYIASLSRKASRRPVPCDRF